MKQELRQHLCACFLTLTYDDEHLPKDGSLHYEDVQKYYKRLRKKAPFRHFTIGEYGPKNLRPHYHAIIFGLSWADELLFREKWPFGFIKVDKVTDGAINYVAGYCCKSQEDYEALGLVRQFTRCSTRPAIGANYLPTAKKRLLDDKLTISRVDGFVQPLPRYYRKKTFEPYKESMSSSEYEKFKADILHDSVEYARLHQREVTPSDILTGIRKLQKSKSKRKSI